MIYFTPIKKKNYRISLKKSFFKTCTKVTNLLCPPFSWALRLPIKSDYREIASKWYTAH